MLRRAVFSLALLPSFAMAEQAPEPAVQAWQLMYQREAAAHHDDILSALQLQAKVQSLQTELDALKANGAEKR